MEKLGVADCKFKHAQTYEDASKDLSGNEYDLIILDNILKGSAKNGIDLAQEVFESANLTPTILLTGDPNLHIKPAG